MQIRFGAHDGPTCPACTATMYVTRRTPHSLYGSTYELQTFECRTCKYEVNRSADSSGLPHLSDAAVLRQQRLDLPG
jgi:transposase-like protein